jgi:Stress responsive A/B Barrel Domain
MLTHHVLFWLKSETTDSEKEAFRKGLESLGGVESVEELYIGTPAPISRAVVDTTYTFSLNIIFKDLAAHDAYQVHDLHKAFLDQFKVYFEKVIIYDAM